MKRHSFAALAALLPFFAQHVAQAQTPGQPVGEPANAAPSVDPTADDLSDIQGLLDEPILSTASKAQESASNAPATTVSISADDLRRYGIRSLDEAINYLSMGMMTQNPLHSVDVGARGVLLTADYGNHVLLLVNGHAMNEQWNGTAYFERGAAVPFEMIDHIEIILGPGSVLYGSNAMLGVINIITKRAKDWSGGHLVAESELPISYRGLVGVGQAFSLLGQDAELTLGLEYYSQSGPTFNFGPQNYGDDAITMMPKRFNPSGVNAGTWGGAADKSYWTKIPSGYARLVVGRFALDIRAANYKRGTPFVSLANQTSGDFNDPNSWERDRWISLDLKHSQPLSSIAYLKSRLYADAYQYDQHVHASAAEDCADGQLNGCVRDGLGIARWVGLEEQLNLDWTHDNRFSTLIGADSRLRYTGNQLDLRDSVTGVAPPDAARVRKTEGSLGVYLQQGIRLAPTFDISTGVRFDRDQRFGHHLSPRGAAAWDAWENGKLKLIYSEAFRAPTTYEVYYADPANQIAAPNLHPEVVRSVEALVEQRVGSHRLLLGVFRSWWKDMVLLETLSATEVAAAIAANQLSAGATDGVQYRNVSTINNLGVNAGFEGTKLVGLLRYGATITAANTKRDEADGSQSNLTVTPKVFGNARVSYKLPGNLPTMGLTGLYIGRRPADRANDGMFTPTPYAPQQFQFRFTFSGAIPRVSGLSYRASADYAVSNRNPYVVGPVQAATAAQPAAQLVPVDTFRVAIGLQYDFGQR